MKILIMIASFALSMTAFANSAQLLITIDKAGVRASEVAKAVETLNIQNYGMGTCYADTQVMNYIPYSNDRDIHGVAMVTLSWECDQNATTLLSLINKSKSYTVYSGSPIWPFPATSGGNKK
jgi:hypothetical protein